MERALELGYPARTLFKWFKGTHEPTIEEFDDVCGFYGIDCREIWRADK